LGAPFNILLRLNFSAFFFPYLLPFLFPLWNLLWGFTERGFLPLKAGFHLAKVYRCVTIHWQRRVEFPLFHLCWEIMEKLKTKMAENVADLNVEIVGVNWLSEDGKKILRVMIDCATAPVDLDLCAKVSGRIDELLDETLDNGEYFLDVCSAGAERFLHDETEVRASVGKYVRVTFKQPQDKLTEFKGYLGWENGNYTLDGFIKSRKKILTFAYATVEKIQLSVKI